MTINHDEKPGFLDDIGHSRRFIRANKSDEKSEIKQKGTKKRIDSSLKYGKKKDEKSTYKPWEAEILP